MKMHAMAEHNSTSFFHKRKRYHGRFPCLISFNGMIPITVGKIAPIHQRRAKLTALLLDSSRPGARNVTAATIAKLRKSKTCPGDV